MTAGSKRAIVETLPDGAPRLVETALGDAGPALVSGIDRAGFALPSELVPTPPAIVGGVRVDGPVVPGAEVRLVAGAIAGTPRPELRARWFVGGAPIAGALGLSLRLTAEMAGQDLTGELEAVNRHGTARQLSTPRRLPGEVPVAPGSRPELAVEIGPEDALVGQDVVVSRLVLAAVDEDALFFAWLADGIEVSADRRRLATDGLAAGAAVLLRVSGGGLAAPVLSNEVVVAAPPPAPPQGYLREDW